MSKLVWKQATVPTVKLSEWLNEKEFEPMSFSLLPDPSSPFSTIVIFAEEVADDTSND